MSQPDKEPKFIKEVRRNIAEEAKDRPDAATYEEAGNAALNMVLAHWLAIDSLNPGLVRDEASREVAASYERKLQRVADKLAREKQEHGDLQKQVERLRVQLGEGKPVVDLAKEIVSLKDKVRQLTFDLSVLQSAKEQGIKLSKKQIKARDVQIQADNLRLHNENRDLKKQLATLQESIGQPQEQPDPQQ